jgi:membrane protease YdiL (CAAX protease family)
MPDPQESFRLMLLAAGILAAAAAVPALIAYRAVGKSSLFPGPAAWTVRWNGWAVLIAFASVVLLPMLVQFALSDSGFYGQLYGPDFPAKATSEDGKLPERMQAAHLRGLWSQFISLPLLVAAILVGLKFGTKASLSQMGLSRERTAANIVLGYFGWLVITPLAFGIFMLAVVLLSPNPDKHPLMDLGPYAGLRELIVFGFQAALFAPMLEELLFRGVLLPWLLQRPTRESGRDFIVAPGFRPHIIYAVALLLCLQSPALMEALQSGRWDQVLPALSSCFFLLALVPFYLLLPLSGRLRSWSRLSAHALRACLASAALFAAIHANVWPSPIPLFVLGLGLGWLAIRARSIVPCIIVHALFNGVAVVYLLVGGKA